MREPVETVLKGLALPRGAEPPPAFLRAVARRRHARRLRGAAVLCGALVVAIGAWRLLPSPPRPGMPYASAVQESSLAALTRTNRDRDLDTLDLPEAVGSGPAAELRADMPLERVEAWLSR